MVAKSNITKKEFTNILNNRIKQLLNFQLSSLDYIKHNSKIRNILLMFNICTILNNEKELTRFPFDRYKKEKWSLEHIHAQNSKELSKKEELIEWTDSILDKIQSQELRELREKISRVADIPEKIKELVSEITSHFGEPDIHTIDNLALLTVQDNSSLNNEIFPIKRNRIMKLEENGSFIPICTRNVFLKYYSEKPTQLFKWTQNDRESYFLRIKNVLKYFLPEQTKDINYE